MDPALGPNALCKKVRFELKENILWFSVQILLKIEVVSLAAGDGCFVTHLNLSKKDAGSAR